MNRTISTALGCISIIAAYTFFLATSAIPDLLSPQGCRMSYMSPSYILQAAFDTSWTPLANRYSLWLYREEGWDSHQLSGTPVLFIPGNAGSSGQVRSIASSATRQYFHSPSLISPEFSARSIKPLDVYAVEFNEDLSAFHGPTLLAERLYVLDAIRYINSLYPPDTQVIVLGHSMGGVVAISLLPSTNISTIITMSTPLTLPPARFDRRIEEVYRNNQAHLKNDPTPIVSLCGGATDLMIPSETCILPTPESAGIYRSTLFTSALEGSWTGAGHREMVWCHQVRWQVARTALELSNATSIQERTDILNKWLRDGSYSPADSLASAGAVSEPDTLPKILPPNENLFIASPRSPGSRLFYLSFTQSRSFVLYVSQGTVRSIAPYRPISLQVEIFECTGTVSSSFSSDCSILDPSSLRLLPTSSVDQAFPVPQVGSDETDGIVLFEANLSSSGKESWIAVKVDGADGRGWLAGGFVASDHNIEQDAYTMTAVLSKVVIPLWDPKATNSSVPLKTNIYLPHLLNNVLIVYRLTPRFREGRCFHNILPPLLVHNSFTEAHYHRLLPPSAAFPRPVLLHTHTSAPFINTNPRRGLNLTIYTVGERLEDGCFPDQLELRVDWWSTIGRWTHRYWPAVTAWPVGIVSLLIWRAWGAMESGQGITPSVPQSLSNYNKILPRLLVGSTLVSLLPLPPHVWLGNVGEPLFAPLAPLILMFCSGLVNLSWLILEISMSLSRYLLTNFERLTRFRDAAMNPRKLGVTVFSIALIFVLIFLFVPWQVAFLVSWIILYYASVISSQRLRPTNTSQSLSSSTRTSISATVKDHYMHANQNTSAHFLLLMTWLLPLAVPILGVWVRTLATAGWTTPFDGDHNFLYVAPFLLFADWSWTCVRKLGRVKLLQRTWAGNISARWSMLVITFIAFFYGPRFNYLVFDFASVGMWFILVIHVGDLYWKGESR